MYDGILLIDKPTEMSSFGAVARVRRVLSERAGQKVKVGHTGTLDPFASGLLILVTGNATKRASDFSKLDKTYEATIIFGKTSSTGDPEGDIISVSENRPSLENIESVLLQFKGIIIQKPPVFSAIKINGQRAYALARRGELPDIPERQVHIYSLEIVKYEYPSLVIRTRVSSGTYIRSLAVDLGDSLNTGAYCSELRRLSVGKYRVTNAEKLTEPIDKLALSVL